MRIIVFFDLPTETSKDLSEYRKFRKTLINEGFFMMQESVYVKLALNNSIVNSIKEKLEKKKPRDGLVQMLTVTEKQFTGIETIVGKVETEELNNTDRLVIL